MKYVTNFSRTFNIRNKVTHNIYKLLLIYIIAKHLNHMFKKIFFLINCYFVCVCVLFIILKLHSS